LTRATTRDTALFEKCASPKSGFRAARILRLLTPPK
jgi:hypothetical protein